MLDASVIADDMFSALLSSFPTMSAAYRSNPEAGVPAHRVMEKMSLGMAQGFLDVAGVTSHVSTHTPATAGPGVWPGTIGVPTTRGFFPAAFPLSGTTIAGVVGATQITMGWTGRAGNPLIDGLVTAACLSIESSLELEYPLSLTSTLVSSGGAVISTLPVFTGVADAAKARILASGLFHFNDDPTLGLAPELIRLVDAWSAGIEAFMTTMNVTIPIPPVPPVGGIIADVSGPLA